MILLRANAQLHEVFTRLIQTMKINVKWTDLFAVIDNYLILQGEVRSLFFNFENRKAVTNIIDLPIKEDKIVEIGDNAILPNVINMVLYAFGKWNSIEGIRVEKDYASLDTLFTDILKELHIKPDFNNVNYRFYKDGIRLTYEDVVQYAIEFKPETELREDEENEEAIGLWHKMCWKKRIFSFHKEDVTIQKRMSERIGNNFYMVGYHCPICNEKLHMVVYPPEKEPSIETEDGGVYLARAYTCTHCNCFYTPYPEKLLAEGDVYFLDFDADAKAYEDYLELLGNRGEHISNYNFNQFVNAKKQNAEQTRDKEDMYDMEDAENAEDIDDIKDMRQKSPVLSSSPLKSANKTSAEATQITQKHVSTLSPKEKENLEEIAEKMESLSDSEVIRLAEKIDEGFYPPKSVAWFEQNKKPLLQKRLQKIQKENPSFSNSQKTEKAEDFNSKEFAPKETDAEKQRERYQAKLNVLPRLSDMQIRDLKSQIKNDKTLSEEEKRAYFSQIEDEVKRKQFEILKKKTDQCQDKNYAYLSHMVDEVNTANLTPEQKDILLKPLLSAKIKRAQKEVDGLLKQLSSNIDRKKYRSLQERLKEYKEIDTSSYTKEFDEAFDKAERQEIANIVNRARKIERSDYTDLLNRLEKEEFSKDLLKPYQDKIIERIKEIDKKAIDELLPGASMTFDEGAKAYDAIANGMFLPELKTNALEMLDKRLRKIKADECEQLALKFQSMLKEKIGENERIFYYPARKILLGEADATEKERFDTAMTIFAADKENYELPIVLFDTSKNKDGREGILLSSDHIFFGSRFDAGTIPVAAITKIEIKTGLLNKGLYVTQKNGAKTKLHYVVNNHEAMDFTECFDEFITYLKEKPESRKIEYLAKEKHETICCLRCGCVYQVGNTCPKCGYKNN